LKGPASRTPQPVCETPTLNVEGCISTRSVGTIDGFSRTGFSCEEACAYTIHFATRRSTSSRLKPVPPRHRAFLQSSPTPAPTEWTRCFSGTGFSREAVALLLLCCCSAVALLLLFIRKRSRHRKTRLGCRLNAGLVEWAERHGCRESRPPPWMADGGGPTERDRSEGTLTKEGPNREQALLVTFSAF
jgi:hypothetical protein